MLVLGIESSCDETAAAVVDEHGHVLSDVVSSQLAVHAPYGGIVPELAARAHLESIVPVVRGALAAVPDGLRAIDAIAVTRGPGLVGALLVGIETGKTLAWAAGVPLVGVDHLAAHLLAVFLRRGEGDAPRPTFPFVGLLASGGHTAIYEVRSPTEITLLGQTRDDAAGETFDKAGKLLGLGYPAGPKIDRLAQHGNRRAVVLPRPMANRRSPDFSFSGLKTAIARHVEQHGVPENDAAMADACASVQHAIVETLADKAIDACGRHGIPRLVLAGGVAANRGLRARARELGEKHGVEVFVPPIASCTDNAAMIAWAGHVRLAHGDRDDPAALAPYAKSPDLKRGKIRA